MKNIKDKITKMFKKDTADKNIRGNRCNTLLYLSNDYLGVKKFSEDAIVPQMQTSGAAGYDLCACLDSDTVSINPGETKLIKTGIGVEIPENCVGLLFPRSGTAIKKGLTLANAVGVIDSDYRGEIGVGIHNISGEVRTIENKTRIAQLVLMPYYTLPVAKVEDLSKTERG